MADAHQRPVYLFLIKQSLGHMAKKILPHQTGEGDSLRDRVKKKFLLPFQPLGAVLKAELFKQNPSRPVKLKIAFSFQIG
jgi:hypothetical protein